MSSLFGISGPLGKRQSAQLFSVLEQQQPVTGRVVDKHTVSERHLDVQVSLLPFNTIESHYYCDEKLRVIVIGSCFNLSEVRSELDQCDGTFPAILAKAYQNDSLAETLAKIDGEFCCVITDSSEKTTKLISDRLGLRFMYWRLVDNAVVFGSYPGPLGNLVSSQLNQRAISCFLSHGHLLGELSFFDKVKLLKPSTILSVDHLSGTIEETRYWAWSEIRPRKMSFDESVHKVEELLVNAVKRRFDSNRCVGVSLSGGLDSRVLLAICSKLNPDYAGVAWTFGRENSLDEVIARQVVALTDWKHLCYPIETDNWLQPRLDMNESTGAMISIEHTSGLEFLDDIASKIDINLNGYVGDVVVGGSLINKRYIDKRMDAHLAELRYGEFMEDSDWNSDYFDLDKLEPNIFANRLRRFTNVGTSGLQGVIEQHKPFVDNELLEFLFSLPDSYRYRNRLYTAMLNEKFSDFVQAIPWQSTGHVLPKSTLMLRVQFIMKRFRQFFTNSDQNFIDFVELMGNPKSSSKIFDLLQNAPDELLANERFQEIKSTWDSSSSKLQKKDTEQVLRAATLSHYLNHLYDSHG